MAKIVYLSVNTDKNKRVWLDAEFLKKETKYDGLNGIWDDFNKKFVAPNTLPWKKWINSLYKEEQ